MDSIHHGRPCWWGLLVLAGGLTVGFGHPDRPAFAATRLVPVDYPTIQSAIDAAAVGDTVLVSPGIYQGVGNRDIEFRGKDLLVKSSQGPAQTIIDCQQQGRGFYLNEWETSAARLEGFTVRRGYATHSSPSYSRGGGIYSGLSSVAIADCRIERCRALGDGGGLYLEIGGPVDRCVFFDNFADGRGGGIYVEVAAGLITNCILEENGSMLGGGICFGGGDEYLFLGNTVVGNFCYGGGGGGIYGTGYLDLQHCIVWDNCSIVEGDEIWCGYADFHCCDMDSSGVDSNVPVVYDADCIYSDPMFCGGQPCGSHTAGDWTLDVNSPCLAEHSPCGTLIGALDAGCGVAYPTGACCLTGGLCVVESQQACVQEAGVYMGDAVPCHASTCVPTATSITSWGRIKATYK